MIINNVIVKKCYELHLMATIIRPQIFVSNIAVLSWEKYRN